MLPTTTSHSNGAPGSRDAARHTAGAKRYKYLRRLLHVRQMDFEFALWQMLYLFTSPQRVYRNFHYRKQTKDQWARDDPAFLVLLSIWLCGTCLQKNLGHCRGTSANLTACQFKLEWHKKKTLMLMYYPSLKVSVLNELLKCQHSILGFVVLAVHVAYDIRSPAALVVILCWPMRSFTKALHPPAVAPPLPSYLTGHCGPTSR